MRHRKTIDKLGRTASHRKALLANLTVALFEKKHITTTEAKAKAARRFSEKLITLAKKESLHARRLVFSRLRQKHVVKLLFDEIAPQYTDRNGGYTRVIKLGQRSGDGARMAILELVGYETASKKKKAKEAKAAAEETAKKKGKAKTKAAEEGEAPEEKPLDQQKKKEKKTKAVSAKEEASEKIKKNADAGGSKETSGDKEE